MLFELTDILCTLSLFPNRRDRWQWSGNEDGDFKVHILAKLVDIACLNGAVPNDETIWNSIVPGKVNIFVWRTLKGRLPVREELDKRGIDLHSLLCPRCNDDIEMVDHMIALCKWSFDIWEKIFEWWNLGNVNAFTSKDILIHNGNSGMSDKCKVVWQVVVRTTTYFIWKERNIKCFGKKNSSVFHIIQDIKLKSFEWVTRRSKWRDINWFVWVNNPACFETVIGETNDR